MADAERDDFYVGYQPRAAAGLARFLRRWIVALLALAAGLAVLLTVAQGKFAQAYFEFGTQRAFEGYVSEQPYPTLLVRRPQADDADVPFSRYLLTVPGKIGAQELLLGLDGKRVSLQGTLVYRDDQTMVEIVPRSVKVLTDARSAPGAVAVSLGRFTLGGEIVDSKCYLGVMKPGEGKPHRACAIRCISGGIPPVFVVRDAAGNALHLLLTGADGRSLNKEVLDFVAEPLELDGEILRDGALLVLRAEPGDFRRRR